MKDPYKNLMLDPEEQEIEDSFDPKAVKSVITPQIKNTITTAATKKLQELKTKPVTIRLRIKDIEKIKQKAERRALPYQTLISSLIHQYANGEIQVGM